MSKTVLVTGATDGIGLETAKQLAQAGHQVIVHGRSEEKLHATRTQIAALAGDNSVPAYRADLSHLEEVVSLADRLIADLSTLDVLINNAGVFKIPGATEVDGLDVRFVVNTLAPYLLAQRLLPLMSSSSRIVNLSSAAQAPVDLEALSGGRSLSDGEAYAQSKLAITMWSAHMAGQLAGAGPVVVAVNPASFIGSKMVKDAYGVAGKDLSVGADILVRAALSDEFAGASGRYYDNDSQRFAEPHADALDSGKTAGLVEAIRSILNPYL